MTVSRVRLGVNIDHVATVRNARGGGHPDPVKAAHLAVEAGADGITAHLREDRRHIIDSDVERLMAELSVPLNFEMAATDEMMGIALKLKPHAACLVPEKRTERTTEGGLDVVGQIDHLKPRVMRLVEAGIRVSMFVEPDPAALEASQHLGAPVVELHTGTYCEAVRVGDASVIERELERLRQGARYAALLGLEVHMGHGLDYETAEIVSEIPQVAELNIGHYLIGEAIFVGLASSIARMRAAIERGCARRAA